MKAGNTPTHTMPGPYNEASRRVTKELPAARAIEPATNSPASLEAA